MSKSEQLIANSDRETCNIENVPSKQRVRYL